jgi:hypothetical protein
MQRIGRGWVRTTVVISHTCTKRLTNSRWAYGIYLLSCTVQEISTVIHYVQYRSIELFSKFIAVGEEGWTLTTGRCRVIDYPFDTQTIYAQGSFDLGGVGYQTTANFNILYIQIGQALLSLLLQKCE